MTVVAPPAEGGAEGTGCGRTVKIRNETINTEQLSPTRELLDLAARVAEDQRRASRHKLVYSFASFVGGQRAQSARPHPVSFCWQDHSIFAGEKK